MSIYLTIGLVIYLLSALFSGYTFIRAEYRTGDRRNYTWGDLATQVGVALLPVVNTTVCVFIVIVTVQDKMRKVWNKRVFKN